MRDHPQRISVDGDGESVAGANVEPSKQELIAELAALRQEVAQLKTTKTAFDAQKELLRILVAMLQTSTGKLMLRSLLQQTLSIAHRLTGAEEGSLFLLDGDGMVIESLLARGATLRAQKQRLVDAVLDKGLAGWVIRHCQVGLIKDTMHDNRWLTLPSQPYTVRSALGVPILQGSTLLGVITLMHSIPGHFDEESAQLMQMTADQMALIIDSAQLHNERQEAEKELQPTGETGSTEGEFSRIGIYILFGEGNFLYANARLAEIFGYSFGELVSLESVLEIATTDSRNFFAQQLQQCLQGRSKTLSCKLRGQRKDGSPIDVEIFGTRTKLYGKFVIIGALKWI